MNTFHLMKGEERYITIIPYGEFKRMKLEAPKVFYEPEVYDIRFKESVLPRLLEIFAGDVDKIYNFLKTLDALKNQPIPSECKKVGLNTYTTTISELLVHYRVNHKSKLITILSIV